MCPIASFTGDRIHFCPSRLQYSQNKRYVFICSDSWDLGGCSYVVTRCRSGALSWNRHTCCRPKHDASLARRALPIKKLSLTYDHSKSWITGKYLASQNMSRERKRWLQFYYIAIIMRHGRASKFVILPAGVRPIFMN